jgi:DNA-directed RNA polymerase subunit M/transcription elongation factor TFIIS
MKFCKECENMLYIRLLAEDSNKLIYYCRNCGNSYDEIGEDNICVLNTNISSQEKAYLQDINEYTKLDPTLPRTKNIKCPNQSCPSNSSDDSTQKKNEVIYLRYDDVNLKYVYICTHCDQIWKTNSQ